MNEKEIINKKEVLTYRPLYIIFAILSAAIMIWSLIFEFAWYHNSTSISNYFGHWSWFVYFTNLSNLFFLVVTTVRIFYRKGFWNNNLQVAASVYMILVFIIYWGAIAPFSFGDEVKNGRTALFCPDFFLIRYIMNNLLWHFLTSIFSVILVFVTIKKINVKINYNFLINFLKIVIFPITYYIFVFIIYLLTYYFGNSGAATIYGFLNFFEPFNHKFDSKYIVVLIDLMCLLITILLFILTYFIMIYILTKINQFVKNKRVTTNEESTTNVSNWNLGSKYILQKSTKGPGWEIKKTGAKKATYVGKTKLDAKNYYYKTLKSNIGTILIEKDKHGKIKTVKKTEEKQPTLF